MPIFLSIYFSIRLEQAVLGIGLALDIAGAVFLAIPDVPVIHRIFFSGKLQDALDHLKGSPRDFYSTHRLLISPDTNHVPAVQEKDEIFKVVGWIERSKTDHHSEIEVITGDQIKESIGRVSIRTEYLQDEGFNEVMEIINEMDGDSLPDWHSWNQAIAVIDGTSGHDVYFFFKGYFKTVQIYTYFYTDIEDRIDTLEARFRRFGLALLISGFIFQGISLVIV